MLFRILGFIAFFALIAMILNAIMNGNGNTGREPRGTYHPRARWQDWFSWLGERSTASGLAHIVKRAALADVRDAYSSAAIDANRAVYRCAACQSFYQDTSVAVLASENQHRCTVCGGTDIGPVRIVDDPSP